MVNALFGNPNLLLHQLHSSYTGPNNFSQTVQMFDQVEIDEYDMKTEKKRKNAVIELLKFTCALKYPVVMEANGSSDDAIYKRCYDLLSTGDIKSAVKYLNANKKMKLALIVSQSTSGEMFRSSVV